MSSTANLIKIGDFARMAGTNLRTLRYYEELGLLQPAARSQGGFRYYRSTDLNRLNMIRNLRDLGLQLDRICELMDTRSELPDRAAFVGRVRAALEEHDRLLDERAQALANQRGQIAAALSKINECSCCELHPNSQNNYCEPCALTGQSLPDTVSALY